MIRALLAAVVGLAAIAAPASAQAGARPCPGQPGFTCATLSVPLDHAGAVPGTIRLRYAVQSGVPRSRPVLVALTGGPGQGGVAFAGQSADTLAPALRRYRLVMLDQRGTGRSGVLRCPTVQRLYALDAFRPAALARCARRIGPRRAFYATADTVLDLDDLRRHLGADKLALSGISYGTHVALQYARAFPANVDRLILDSIVGPDGPDPFLRDTYRYLPRILREQCRGTRCDGITADPVADVAALVRRLNSRGPLRGTRIDHRGQRRPTAYRVPDELQLLLVAGDLNPFMQAWLPAAMAAARRGDPALLMRLRRIGQGPPTRLRELSFGLNVATGCLDTPLPYALTTPIAERPALAQAALAAVAATDLGPFDPQTVLRTGYVDDCLLWPQTAPKPPFTGPLPDVPALLLGGRQDLRTPVENAFETAGRFPRASVVALRGAGHDTLDGDLTGCVRRALTRFVADRGVGRPCAGRDNGVQPFPIPPRSLRGIRPAPGVGGLRGRAVFGTLVSIEDARLAVLQQLFAGLPLRGGGLRGGRFSARLDAAPVIRLRDYAFVPRFRVSGTLRLNGARITGRLAVRGPRGTSGELTVTAREVTGVLGGRQVRYAEAPATATAARLPAARSQLALRAAAETMRAALGPRG